MNAGSKTPAHRKNCAKLQLPHFKNHPQITECIGNRTTGRTCNFLGQIRKRILRIAAHTETKQKPNSQNKSHKPHIMPLYQCTQRCNMEITEHATAAKRYSFRRIRKYIADRYIHRNGSKNQVNTLRKIYNAKTSVHATLTQEYLQLNATASKTKFKLYVKKQY